MSAIRPLASLALAALTATSISAPAAAAPSSLQRETVIAPDGTRLTRMRVEAPAAPGPARFPERMPAFAPLAAGGGADTLWVDRDHQMGIPEEMAVSGDGQHVVAGWGLNAARAAHYARTAAVPTWTRAVESLTPVAVDVTQSGETVALTGSGSPLVLLGGAGDSLFVRPHTVYYEGQFIACDDSAVVMAVSATYRDTTLVFGRDADDGVAYWSLKSAKPVVGIDFSSGGHYLAITHVDEVIVRNGFTSAVLDTLPLPERTSWPAAIAADGTVATGGFSPIVRVWQRGLDNQYTVRFAYDTRTTWVSAVDISDDASTVLAGTFTNSEPPSGAAVMLDAASGAPHWTLADFGDLVSAVSLSSRGLVGAAGSWGRQGGAAGLALAVFERDLWYPALYAFADDDLAALGVDSLGSVMDLELSGDGTTCAVGFKRQHARELGAGGCVAAIGLPGEPAPAPGRPAPSAEGPPGPALAAHPQPAAPRTTLSFRAPPGGGELRLAVHDAAGRLVRVLSERRGLEGDQRVEWDGRDDAGRPLAPGLYFARLTGPGLHQTSKVVLTR